MNRSSDAALTDRDGRVARNCDHCGHLTLSLADVIWLDSHGHLVCLPCFHQSLAASLSTATRFVCSVRECAHALSRHDLQRGTADALRAQVLQAFDAASAALMSSSASSVAVRSDDAQSSLMRVPVLTP